MPALLLLALSCVLLPNVKAKTIALAIVYLFVAIAIVLWAEKLYFGSYLPLSFYIKAKNGYIGYKFRSYSFTNGLTFLKGAGLYLLALAFFTRRASRNIVLLFAIPLLSVLAYLCTVKQIMGFHDRYYLPYLPLLLLPALLAVDTYFSQPRTERPRLLQPLNVVAVVIIVAFLAGMFPYKLQTAIEARLEPHVEAYNVPVYGPETKTMPYIGYFHSMNILVLDIAAYLPPRTNIASTEVGLLGVGAPSANIIDMAGLNDSDIALHGFDVHAFLARRPDIIWLPHFDYTWQRGVLMTAPEFLRDYDYYAGALDFGLAVRKDSPARAIVEQRLAAVWPKTYPGTTPEQSLVHQVTWPAGKTTPPVEPHNY